MKIYYHTVQGKRESNEDQHFVYTNLDGKDTEKNNINLIGVFDGHGGKLVSKYLKDNLPRFFIKKFKENIFLKSDKFCKYVIKVYDLLQEQLMKEHPKAVNYCGSTACITIHIKGCLWVLNVGDSRIVLNNKNGIAIQLSKDHKPNSPDERTRIEKMGGKITFDGMDWRIKDLSLSRAFGDLDCMPFVTHLPQIYKCKLSSGDKFLIKACDGLWDVIGNQDAVDFIQDLINKNFKGNYAKSLCEYALEKGSMDNITIIIYFLD